MVQYKFDGSANFPLNSNTISGYAKAVHNQSFPALAANPVDVAGAGDSLLAVMAAGMSSGQSTMVTSAVAACMAAVAVNTMGNKPISCARLKGYIETVF